MTTKMMKKKSDSDRLSEQVKQWYKKWEDAVNADDADAESMPKAADHFKPGKYVGVPRYLYDLIPAVNATTLKNISTHSPAHALHWANQSKDSDALRFGDAFHVACLEPSDFPKRFVLWPDEKSGTPPKTKKEIDMRPGGRRGTKAYEAFEQTNKGKTVLREQDYDQILEMSEQLHAHPAVQQLLSRGPQFREVTLIWVDKHTGLLCKARADILIEDEQPTCIDYKTTQNAKPSRFGTQVFDYGYDIQDAHYCMGVAELTPGKPLPNMIIPAIEKSGPYLPVIYRIDIPTKRLGWTRARQAMDLYAECVKKGHWPGYGGDEIIDINAPAWALRQFNIKTDD